MRLAAYARAADLAPEDAEAQMLVGVLHLRTGNLAAAEGAFRRQIELGRPAGSTCELPRYRGHTMLGDVHAAREEHDAAMAAYAEAQREVKALLERDADHAGLRRDLSVTCDRIGDMHCGKGGARRGARMLSPEPGDRRGAGQARSQNPIWQHDLSVSHDRIGDMLDKKGDREGGARKLPQGAGDRQGPRRARCPATCAWQWDLSVSHDRIGDVLIAEGKLDDALASYRHGLEIAEALVKRDPGHAGWQRDLAVSYHKIGSLEAIGNPGEARELLEKGRAIIARLARIAAHQAQWRSDLSQFDEVLKSLDG